LCKFKDEILCVLNNDVYAGGIFCDLTEVLDYVNHEALLSKLKMYRIQTILDYELNPTITENKKQE
jgi:hypothetical protein